MRVEVSPDGTSLALDVESALVDVWSYEIDRAVMTRLTFKGLNTLVGWSPDGGLLTAIEKLMISTYISSF